MHSYTTRPFEASGFREAARAELVFGGVEHAGPSFEGRVFLNNPGAGPDTAMTPDEGYAGSFHVYAYGWPLPPAMAEAKARQRSGDPPVAPVDKRLRADEAAVRAAVEGSDEVTVTVVPIPVDPGGALPERPFETVEAVFDRGG